MKIGDGTSIPGGEENLIERMRAAHTEEAQEAKTADTASTTRATADTQVGAPRSMRTDSANPLEESLLSTAADALGDKFDDADKLRGAVVEDIVDQRFGEALTGEERESIVEAMKGTLIDDVEFKNEVDNMLVLAARELARRDG